MKYAPLLLIFAFFLAYSANAGSCLDGYLKVKIPLGLGNYTTICIEPTDIECDDEAKCHVRSKEFRDAFTSLVQNKVEEQ